MTAWNGNLYAYEPLGMTRRVTASGIEYDHLYSADDERLLSFQPGAPSRWTIRDLDGKVLRELQNSGGTCGRCSRTTSTGTGRWWPR
jgi:hypothetical protein